MSHPAPGRGPRRPLLPGFALLLVAGAATAQTPATAPAPTPLSGPSAAAAAPSPPATEEAPPAPSLSFEEYDPPSTLVVPATHRTAASYPFVDVHNHQWEMDVADLAPVVEAMDAMHMAVMVNLSGRSGDDPLHLQHCLENVAAHAPGRFLVFTNVSFEGVGEPGWTERAVQQLRADIAAGAAGLKIYKNLGMDVFDGSGARVPVDDSRLAPLWDTCGELGVPVLIHSGDPAPFWQPWDAQNERWLELKERPRRKRDPTTGPSWEQVMGEHWSLFEQHPGTTFISAHLAWLGNDLQRLGALLDAHPNVYTEIGAVIAELGRQPRAARAFFIAHQDRLLFGKDVWEPSEYECYFRVLETADEYFDYYRRRHAFWKMYGLELPDEVLRKLYYGNALAIFPQLDRSLFPAD